MLSLKSDPDLALPPYDERQQLLADWATFIYGGFRERDFTRRLADYLTRYCGFEAYRGEGPVFWEEIFSEDIEATLNFVEQFGQPQAGPDSAWLGREPTGLNRALCALVEPVYADLIGALHEGAQISLDAIMDDEIETALTDPDFRAEWLAEGWDDEAELRRHLEEIYDPGWIFEQGLPLDDETRQLVTAALGSKEPPPLHPVSLFAVADMLTPPTEAETDLARQTTRQTRRARLSERRPATRQGQLQAKRKEVVQNARHPTTDTG